jgi:hypothetical protein
MTAVLLGYFLTGCVAAFVLGATAVALRSGGKR